ncbi:MAG: hypothetical protein BWY80_00290 [Firmicutes bacterium ADurb.Bin456]|nr:MAG: hypothetical protein BWY80_00290 [Firmicutes bacterium ADurb.Bin456]
MVIADLISNLMEDLEGLNSPYNMIIYIILIQVKVRIVLSSFLIRALHGLFNFSLTPGW